jgi:hypothetical protein
MLRSDYSEILKRPGDVLPQPQEMAGRVAVTDKQVIRRRFTGDESMFSHASPGR